LVQPTYEDEVTQSFPVPADDDNLMD